MDSEEQAIHQITVRMKMQTAWLSFRTNQLILEAPRIKARACFKTMLFRVALTRKILLERGSMLSIPSWRGVICRLSLRQRVQKAAVDCWSPNWDKPTGLSKYRLTSTVDPIFIGFLHKKHSLAKQHLFSLRKMIILDMASLPAAIQVPFSWARSRGR